MFCTKCGATLQESSKFCPQCGAQQPVLETTTPDMAPELPKVKTTSSSKVDPSKKEKSLTAPLIAYGVIAVVIFLIYQTSGNTKEDIPDPSLSYSECFHKGIGWYQEKNEYPTLANGGQTIDKIRSQCDSNNQHFKDFFAKTSSETNSQSIYKSFDDCLDWLKLYEAQNKTTPITIMESSIVRMIRFPTNDGTKTLTCSKLDNNLVITSTTSN